MGSITYLMRWFVVRERDFILRHALFKTLIQQVDHVREDKCLDMKIIEIDGRYTMRNTIKCYSTCYQWYVSFQLSVF